MSGGWLFPPDEPAQPAPSAPTRAPEGREPEPRPDAPAGQPWAQPAGPTNAWELLGLRHRADGWWITGVPTADCQEYGPYGTKAEAEDDRRGVRRTAMADRHLRALGERP